MIHIFRPAFGEKEKLTKMCWKFERGGLLLGLLLGLFFPFTLGAFVVCFFFVVAVAYP